MAGMGGDDYEPGLLHEALAVHVVRIRGACLGLNADE